MNKIKKIMIKYDVKHPLRDEEKAKDTSEWEYPFDKKIIAEANGPGAYIHYKKNNREVMEYSRAAKAVEKKKKMHAAKTRLILKYRIYGRDGVSDKEF